MEERPLSFAYSEEQKIMKETASKLVHGTIGQNAHEVDESREMPRPYLQKFWELGTVLPPVPEEYGGYGMERSAVMNAIILEELAAGDMSFAVAAALPSLFINTLLLLATPEQQRAILPSCCGETYRTGTMALCEPHFASDAAAPRTTATRKNNAYVLSGAKCFVPMADEAQHFIIAASLEGAPALFIVPAGAPGLAVAGREKNLGLYGLKTFTIKLDNCEVPAEYRLGASPADYGRALQYTRTGLAAVATGVCRASYEYARAYAVERVQFGEPIASRQSVAFMIAEMAYEVESMRLMTWQAASLLESGKDASRESYLAKAFAGDLTMKITDYGVQILGGHGYIREHPVERYYRNGRGIAILEGMASV